MPNKSSGTNHPSAAQRRHKKAPHSSAGNANVEEAESTSADGTSFVTDSHAVLALADQNHARRNVSAGLGIGSALRCAWTGYVDLFSMAISHETGFVHNSHTAKGAQARFIEQFLPNSGTVAEVQEPNDAGRGPVQVQ